VLLDAARQDADRILAAARADAERERSQAHVEYAARLELARKEARRLITRYGGPNASPEEARLRIIRDLIAGSPPGPIKRLVNPDLVSGCRLYLRKGKTETASLLILPRPGHDRSDEDRP